MFARLSAWATGIVVGAWIAEWINRPHLWRFAEGATYAVVLLMAGAAVMDYREARRIRERALPEHLRGHR